MLQGIQTGKFALQFCHLLKYTGKCLTESQQFYEAIQLLLVNSAVTPRHLVLLLKLRLATV